mmetsp:Transcript_94239/g.224346  ORF Transcript_94239/g.224346 Transcript_94239/m.224346 type:complete len:219 (-) Transcript_94239:11-667(-)
MPGRSQTPPSLVLAQNSLRLATTQDGFSTLAPRRRSQCLLQGLDIVRDNGLQYGRGTSFQCFSDDATNHAECKVHSINDFLILAYQLDFRHQCGDPRLEELGVSLKHDVLQPQLRQLIEHLRRLVEKPHGHVERLADDERQSHPGLVEVVGDLLVLTEKPLEAAFSQLLPLIRAQPCNKVLNWLLILRWQWKGLLKAISDARPNSYPSTLVLGVPAIR